MNIRSFFALVLSTIFILSNYSFASEMLDVSAKSAVLLDASSGRILYSKNSDEKLPIASTTKIVTAIVALENSRLDEVIKTSPKAAHVEGSSIWLEENETITMENALYGLMLNSGNDAAIAIAEHISGDTDIYADLMNNLVKKVGANNSHFVNPNGLDAPNHYTTAYDLALITRYGLKIPKFAEIVKTKEKKIPWEGHQWNRTLKNHNKLLWQYQYCDGIKTGFTKKSGRCLVTSATKDGWQLIGVTLNDGDDWNDNKKMFEYGFNTYAPKLVFNKNQYVKTIIVNGGKSSKITLVTDDKLLVPLSQNEENITYQYEGPEVVTAPVSKCDDIGKLNVYLDGKLICSIGLKSSEYIEKLDLINDIKKMFRNWVEIFGSDLY